MKEIIRKHGLLIVATVLSLILLIVFMSLQYTHPDVLAMPIQWLVVVGAPVILAFLAAGYITKFKGFGLELKSRLQAPIESVGIIASGVATKLIGDDKQSLDHLRRLTPEQKSNIKRLAFKSPLRDYYDEDAIKEYLRELKNLEFIEINDTDNNFVCLLPIDVLRPNGRTSNNRVDDFVEAMRNDEVVPVYSSMAITTRIKHDANVVDALTKLRAEAAQSAAVMEGNRLFGVIHAADLERQIASDVLELRNR